MFLLYNFCWSRRESRISQKVKCERKNSNKNYNDVIRQTQISNCKDIYRIKRTKTPPSFTNWQKYFQLIGLRHGTDIAIADTMYVVETMWKPCVDWKATKPFFYIFTIVQNFDHTLCDHKSPPMDLWISTLFYCSLNSKRWKYEAW